MVSGSCHFVHCHTGLLTTSNSVWAGTASSTSLSTSYPSSKRAKLRATCPLAYPFWEQQAVVPPQLAADPILAVTHPQVPLRYKRGCRSSRS
jgi:hypothetical protein